MKQPPNNILTILFFSAFIAFSSAQVFIGNFDFNDNHQTHFTILEDGKIKYGKIIYKIILDILKIEIVKILVCF
jgi:hypothetical protein